MNTQLSPFDERVRGVCHLRGRQFVDIEYENDHALDSGVWYKFIRDGRWRDYEYVLFAGEGLLFADPGVLRALVSFARRSDVHFIASGHEKRRVQRATMMRTYKRGQPLTALDEYHDRMIAETFEVFCRDPQFRTLFERWGSDFETETEHHVPGVTRQGERWRRLRGGIQRRWGSPHSGDGASWAGRVISQVPHALDRWVSRARLGRSRTIGPAAEPLAYAAGSYEARPIRNASAVDVEDGITFHRADGPEWFGCTVIHLMSRSLLERFRERLDRFAMYDALDLPFAGSTLEIVWGFVPAWLGVEKWFANGFHRVRKHFATYQREDYPPEIASYINRYHRGRLAVDWRGDFLKLEAWESNLGDLRRILPADYF